jgi:hypothetical protein
MKLTQFSPLLKGSFPYLIAVVVTSILAIWIPRGFRTKEVKITPSEKNLTSPQAETPLVDSPLNTPSLPSKPSSTFSPDSSLLVPTLPQVSLSNSGEIYNVKAQPPFHPNADLQLIVDQAVQLAESRNLPIEKLSISLVDLSSTQCCHYAAHNEHKPRYPASVVKVFWLVMLYHQYHQQGISPEQISPEWKKIIAKTIQKSDNETASKIFDKITKTQSSSQELTSDKLDTWIDQRYLINQFYLSANYPPLNISQKTFPISNEITSPIGPDLQIRQIYGKESPPVRNYLSTDLLARLFYEIAQNKAVSPEYSQELKKLMKRDLNPQVWQQEPFNPIAGFLAEYLPIQTNFYAKMGWTFSNRNDAAIISSSDGKIKYILIVFGDDPAYYEDKQFFPLLSKKIYQKLKVSSEK